MDVKKINLNVQVTEKLLEDLDQYALDMNMSRASAVAMILTNTIKADKGMATIKDLMQAYNEQKNNPQLV